MANLGAVNVGWYFPTPLALIPHIAALFDVAPAWRRVADPKWNHPRCGTYALLDPAAGDGAALLAFAHALFGDPFPTYPTGPTVKLYGCELEEVRAAGLRTSLQNAHLPAGGWEARHADAFQLTLQTNTHARGLSFLWANPPYDRDPNPVYGRLEQAFLARFTPFLTPGSGILIFLVPGHVLQHSAAYLAAEYDEIVAYRFPDGFYADYKQVVVLARRRATPLPFGAGAAAGARLTAWAVAPAALPELPAPGTGRARFALVPGAQDGLADFAVNLIDVDQVLRYVIPWTAGTLDVTAPPSPYPLAAGPRRGGQPALQTLPDVGLDQALDHFLHPVRRVLMPPRAAHRALFTAAGMFNNLTMRPDDPASGLPPIIIKGRFTKDFVDVKQNRDQEGHLTSTIAVQQPSMQVRMRTLALPSVQVDLKPGTKPTGTTDPAQMTIADVLHHYGRGLVTWMGRQFPPRHDPADAGRLLPLPPLARPPFQAQAHVFQACLKQLARGENVIIQGEVGTGKSQILLSILGALTTGAFPATREALRRLGYWNGRRALRPVANVVILVPPHLVNSWRDQVGMVLPGADVILVERLTDLDAPPPAELERSRILISAARNRQHPTCGPRILGDGASPGAGLTLFLLSREKAKLGPGQQLAYRTHPTHDPRALAGRTCPRCGHPVEVADAEILRKRLTCTARPITSHRRWSGLATQLAQLLLPAYPNDETILALVPARILRTQILGEQFPQDADESVARAQRPEGGEERAGEAGSQAGNEPATLPDLPPAVRQERWLAGAVARNGQGKTRLDLLLLQVQTAVAAVLVPHAIRPALPGLIATLSQLLPLMPPATRWWWVRLISRAATLYGDPERPAESPLPALLRGWLLLHLALPRDQQAARISRSACALARYGAGLPAPDPTRKAVQEALGRLLLFLLPVAPACLARLIPAVQRILYPAGLPDREPVWAAFARTHRRLQAELAAAAQEATDPRTRTAVQEAQRQRLLQGGPDWSDLAIDLTKGRLVWRSTSGMPASAATVEAAYSALGALLPLGGFRRPSWPCGEPLYQVTASPRRWPLARYIARKRRRLFDLVVLDEMHEFNTVGSAQEQAAHLLLQLGVPALGLTGSLSGGYASSVFANLWAFSARFRTQFGYHDKGKFVRRYGYLKVLKILPERGQGPQLREYGKASLRTEYSEDPLIRELGESPGFLPALIVDHLLSLTVIILKEDLDTALPPLVEQPAALAVAPDNAAGQQLLRHYRALESRLLEQIGRDRWDKDRRGRLLGALAELPGFLDLGTDDVGNTVGKDGIPRYEIRYAEGGSAGGELVARGKLIPATTLLPKETWLLEQLAAQLQRERNVLVYIRHTGNRRFVARLQRLLREHLQITAAFLDATKVPPHTREDWIRQAVVGMRRRVLLVNPEAVKTGLNCLTPYFKTVIWYELTYNTLTYRQANGRVHRIGADPAHPIEILVPVYAQTAQEIALDLQARKLTASLQLDAGSVESALQAAGAGGQDAEAALQQLAMSSMGQAIFEILSGTGRRENTFAPVPVPVAPVFAPLVPPPPAPVVREHLVAGPQLSLFDNLDHGASAPPATSARRAAPAPDPPRAKTPKQGTLFG